MSEPLDPTIAEVSPADGMALRLLEVIQDSLGTVVPDSNAGTGAAPDSSALENEALQESYAFATPKLFNSYGPIEIPPFERIPNFGHVAIAIAIGVVSSLISVLLTGAALHLHMFGVSSLEQASSDIRYALGGQALLYLLTFLGCALIFPHLWSMGLFAGLQWNGAVLRQRFRLILAAVFFCFTAAILDGALIPQPKDAPIDHLFRMPGAPWLLLGFGVTIAPFIEEMAFRGFLLPALATAIDWSRERFFDRARPFSDFNVHPQWSMLAQIIASILTSIPFALMHAPQNAGSFGSLALMMVVSLVLCAVRLSTRSLAASTVVHACYNMTLFLLMLIGTHGFTNLEKL